MSGIKNIKLLVEAEEIINKCTEDFKKQGITFEFKPKIIYTDMDVGSTKNVVVARCYTGVNVFYSKIIFDSFMSSLEFKKFYDLEVSEQAFHLIFFEKYNRISEKFNQTNVIELFKPIYNNLNDFEVIIKHELWHLIEANKGVGKQDFLSEGTAIYVSEKERVFDKNLLFPYPEISKTLMLYHGCANFINQFMRGKNIGLLLDSDFRKNISNQYKNFLKLLYANSNNIKQEDNIYLMKKQYDEFKESLFVENPCKENLIKHYNKYDYANNFVEEIKNQDLSKLIESILLSNEKIKKMKPMEFY